MEKKKLLFQLFNSFIKGAPLIGTIKKKIFPPKIKQVSILDESKYVVIQEDHKQSHLFWLLKLVVETGGVVVFILLMKKYNVSYDDIFSIFNLFNNK